ncbi:MAG: LAGLIDADG family homing endonuclease [Candidatus Woesearchaeota archaeon]
MSPELAEIIGLLCAEGCHIIQYSDYWETFRGRKRFRKHMKSERIEFYNKDKTLLSHYQDLLLKEFSYPTKVTRFGKINICKRDIIREVINNTELGNLIWRVPSKILSSDDSIKKAFVRGYFDGDGTASKSIRFFSTNIEGLSGVLSLLNQVGFSAYMIKPQLKPNRKPLYALRIPNSEKERFLNTVEPISKRPGNVGINAKQL